MHEKITLFKLPYGIKYFEYFEARIRPYFNEIYYSVLYYVSEINSPLSNILKSIKIFYDEILCIYNAK